MISCDLITADIRSDICRKCPTPCEHQHDPDFHLTACAKCEIGRWGNYGRCGSSAAQPATTTPAVVNNKAEPPPSLPAVPTLLRIMRAYKKAGRGGVLFGRDRRVRREACAVCPYRIETGHAGLYGCGRCTVCGGRSDKLRMIRPWMTCREGRWLTVQS